MSFQELKIKLIELNPPLNEVEAVVYLLNGYAEQELKNLED